MVDTFHNVAQSIIHDSIKSAIFIDDQIPNLFSEEEEKEGPKCKPLYESFRANECSLDFFKFDSSWKNKIKLLFERKDLLILDWELDNTEPKYQSTLEVVNQAVFTDSLHFVCIYSNTRDAVNEIFYKLLAHYSLNGKETAIFQKDTIIDFLEEEYGTDTDTLLPILQTYLRELALVANSPNSKQIRKDIAKLMGSHFGEFKKIVSKTFRKHKSFCELTMLGFALNGEYGNEVLGKEVYVKCDVTNNYLQINNTIFAVFQKGQPEARDLYDKFCDAIIKSNENFLTLMSLEIRNKVLKRSGFIGKELSSVREKAFFHHMDKIRPETAFEEYLIELWKNYNTVFLYTEKPRLFNVLEEYRNGKDSSGDVEDKDLAILNYHYNIHHNHTQDKSIGFGDIFEVEKEGEAEYLLCVTPHCDCLRPEKIEGSYYFVKGKSLPISTGLKGAEGKYISFIKLNDNIICVEWACKPFTIYLNEEQRRTSTTKDVTYRDKVCNLMYCDTIKENYAQRIANHAFSTPIRVGISFAEKG